MCTRERNAYDVSHSPITSQLGLIHNEIAAGICTFPYHLYAVLPTQCCVFVPNRFPFLQDSLDPFWLSSELQIWVVIGEDHMLDLAVHVFFARCWIRVIEWDYS